MRSVSKCALLNLMHQSIKSALSACLLTRLGVSLVSFQTGLYRLSGSDRMVKELKEKFLRGKTFPLLSKVEDIHAITGLLKDFLRNLKEPLLTFRLNSNFMVAAGESELKLKLIKG